MHDPFPHDVRHRLARLDERQRRDRYNRPLLTGIFVGVVLVLSIAVVWLVSRV